MCGAKRGDHRDDEQNDSDDNQAEGGADGRLQMPSTSLYISITLARTAR